MQTNSSIGVAVVGYGYWSPKLIRNIETIPAFALRGICEKDESRHAAIQETHPNVAVYRHYRDAFADDAIQVVVIATIPSSHYRIARQALEAGKHVLVEKPLTLSIEDGAILTALAKEKGLTLMVDHTYLYSPAIQALRDTIRGGSLGKIYAVESDRINLGLFQRDTNVLWDLAPHDFSILLYLFDERPTHVMATGTKTVVHPKQARSQESDAHIMLYYSSGFTAHLHISWISPIKVRQLTVIGSESMALYDQLAENQLTIFNQGVYPNEDEGESGPLFTYKTGETHAVPLPQGSEDLKTMLLDFAQAVETGTAPLSNAELGMDVVRILVAAQDSLNQRGEKVYISYSGTNVLKELLSKFRPR